MSTFWSDCFFLVIKGPKGWLMLIALLFFSALALLFVFLGLKWLAEEYQRRKRVLRTQITQLLTG